MIFYLCNSLLIGLGTGQQQHPAVHTGQVSTEKVLVVAVGVSGMWQVTGEMQHMKTDTLLRKKKELKFNLYSYPHTLRDSWIAM